jgi:hypothetical protein
MSNRRKLRETLSALAGLQHAEPESSGGVSPDDFRWHEDGCPEGATEVTGQERYRVEIILFKTRPLDSDNPYVKALVDELRYHKLIPDDNVYSLRTFVRQFKVKHRHQEGTKLIIRQIK